MNSSRPYLVRARYEWIVDNDCTPHMLVNSEYPAVQVPQGFASDGQIVLNISPSAVRHCRGRSRQAPRSGPCSASPWAGHWPPGSAGDGLSWRWP